MKTIKVAVLFAALVSGMQLGGMELPEPNYISVDRSENRIIAETADGIIYRLEHNPMTGEYSGERFRRVQRVPGRIPASPAGILHMNAEKAEQMYKELSRVEKG